MLWLLPSGVPSRQRRDILHKFRVAVSIRSIKALIMPLDQAPTPRVGQRCELVTHVSHRLEGRPGTVRHDQTLTRRGYISV